MLTIATGTINTLDLINFSQGIAQLNLGYLGISVAILGGLAGIFVYFNIKPLRDALEKQERVIGDLKKEAQELLSLSAKQSEKMLADFKKEQDRVLVSVLKEQKDKMSLETINKIQEAEQRLFEKMDKSSEDKDLKLKQIILSETTNKVASLEKELTAQLTNLKADTLKSSSDIKSSVSSLKVKVEEIDEDVKELQVYKFSKEGKMGAIIYSIDLLARSIDDYLRLKELHKKFTPEEEVTFSWKVKLRLEGLLKEIGDIKIENEYVTKIETLLVKIKNESCLVSLVAEVRARLK